MPWRADETWYLQCYSTSNKTKHNLDLLISWLTQRAH